MYRTRIARETLSSLFMATPAVPPLPAVVGEAMIYLSQAQADVLTYDLPHPVLQKLVLPCWVPHRLIADALGLDHSGVEEAELHVGGPYLWATEFENVHDLWEYHEPEIQVGSVWATCSEDYYHSQKPDPFDKAAWEVAREAVMERAVRAKLTADPNLGALLLATAPYPLLSIKRDQVWGFEPGCGGLNLLAKIWVRLRAELLMGP
eukprot:m.132789 g.132789  ORF g.132789 m.132789 type:complete len:206 (-) comp29631_c0_seq5:1541-2158(-)